LKPANNVGMFRALLTQRSDFIARGFHRYEPV
jgi:hypothetical protein